MSLLLGADGILDIIFSAIGNFLYPLFSIFFMVIDTVQYVFFAFAGIGNAGYDGKSITAGTTGELTDQGIVYYLMQSSTVKNLFMSILILALVLIIVFTVMAFIKNVYSAKPKNWKDIIASSIKGLANFIFLPVCCLLGVWVGNILLQAINGATSGGGAVNMSNKLFISAAYNANKYRTGDASGKDLAVEIYNAAGLSDHVSEIKDNETPEYYAQLVDECFAQGKMDIYTKKEVKIAYNLWEVNYLLLIVGGIFMLYVLGSLAFAMVRRMFYILVLFVVSPGLCAMYPLDEGKAVGSWKGEFIKQVLSAYGAVAGLNIFFALLPLVEKIDVFGTGGGLGGSVVDGVTSANAWPWSFMNSIVQLFVMIVGLMIVKELISLISGFVGGEDAYSKGSGLMTGAFKKFKDTTSKTVGTVAKGAGVFAKANAVKKAGGSWWGSIADSAKSGAKGLTKSLTGADIDGFKKTIADAQKDGAEHAFKKQEKAVEKFTKDNTQKEVNKVMAQVKAKIRRSGGAALTTEDMADLLELTGDKNAQKVIAEFIAAHNNRVNIDTDHGGSGRTTTAEKVLESRSKLLQEESRRQEAYGANTDFSGARDSYKKDITDMANLSAQYGGLKYDSSTDTFIGGSIAEKSSGEMQKLKQAAEAKNASPAAKRAYQDALDAQDVFEKYRKLAEKQKSDMQKIKSAANNFASGLDKLAENYSGDIQSALKKEANNIRSAVNNSKATYGSISGAISLARNELAKLSKGTELIKVLETGKTK